MNHALPLALALLLPAAPILAETGLRIMLDAAVNPAHGPILIAQRMDHYDREGIAVELLAPETPTSAQTALARGQADLALMHQFDMHLAIHEGAPLIQVGILLQGPQTCLLVLEDGPVHEIAELAGKRIGVPASSGAKVLLDAMLTHHGVARGDVTAVEIEGATSDALLGARVEAAVTTSRIADLMRLEMAGSPGRCFLPEDGGVPAYDELVYVARRDGLPSTAIAAFLAATERSVTELRNNPETAWKIVSATQDALVSPLNQEIWAESWDRFALRPAAVSTRRAAGLEAFLQELGAIAEALEPSQLVIDVTRPMGR